MHISHDNSLECLSLSLLPLFTFKQQKLTTYREDQEFCDGITSNNDTVNFGARSCARDMIQAGVFLLKRITRLNKKMYELCPECSKSYERYGMSRKHDNINTILETSNEICLK